MTEAGGPAPAPADERSFHAGRALQLAEEALRPGVRARRAELLAAVAQVHATLAVSAPAAPGTAVERSDRPMRPRRRTTAPSRGAVASGPGAETLFDRLKGQDGIAEAVREFYTRVLDDPQLAHYFDGVAMWRLQRHMVAFLVQATGGPAAYDGKEMADAHAHLGVTGRDFDRVVRHLVETLTDAGIAPRDVDEVVGALAPVRPFVVTAAPPPRPTPLR